MGVCCSHVEAVEGQAGDSADSVADEVLHDLGGDGVIVDHHIEQLVAGRHLHRGVQRLRRLEKVDDWPVHAAAVSRRKVVAV